MIYLGTVRNFIDIEGLSSYENLPKTIKGQVVQISECENIQLPNTKLNIKNVFQILINVEVKSTRTVETPINTLAVVDGVKNFKILYYDNSNKAGILDIKIPFNTFIELKDNKQEIKDIRIYVIDAYFQLLPYNILYSHLLYYIDVDCSSSEKNKEAETISTITPENFNINYDMIPDNPVSLKLEHQTMLNNNPVNLNLGYQATLDRSMEKIIKPTIQYEKELDFSNVINEISVSEDKPRKVNPPLITEEPILSDKWSKFIDIEEEYI